MAAAAFYRPSSHPVRGSGIVSAHGELGLRLGNAQNHAYKQGRSACLHGRTSGQPKYMAAP